MKLVRIWFKKTGTARYMSHLDLNRCVARAVHKAKIPIWYTQGFNPHAFITFALPLSLGMSGERESMDMKLEEDIPPQELMDRLNSGLPKDIKLFDVTEPVMKPGKIAFASFSATIDTEDQDAEEVAKKIEVLLSQNDIIVPKHTKNGMRDIDIKPYFKELEMTVNKVENKIYANIILPAGSTENINPMLLQDAIKKYLGLHLYTDIVRTNIYDENFDVFA